MPGLETKGNIIENFGHYYPTPIIQLIEVLPRGFNVTVSMYFNFSTGVTDEEVQALLGKPAVFDSNGNETDPRQGGALDDLQIYVFYVLGKNQADDLISKKKTNLWSELIKWNTPFYKTEGLNEAMRPIGTINWLRKPLVEWSLDGEISYDTNNNRLYKYYTTFEMAELFDEDANFETDVVTTDSTYLFGAQTLVDAAATSGGGGSGSPTAAAQVQTGAQSYDVDALHQDFEGQLTLFAFSSTINMDNFGIDGGPTVTPAPFVCVLEEVEEPLREYKYITPLLNENLIEKQFSDTSYEIVFKDGLINTADDLSYVDQNEQVYNAVPFKSLAGTYHKQDSVVHQQVVDLFNELLVSYYNENDEKIMKVVDNVSYILATAGHTVNILPELEGYRATYSADTDPTTLTGGFYQGYKDLILSVNSQILTGASLERRFLKNLKIIDARTQRLPDTSWNMADKNSTYTDFNNPLYCIGEHAQGLMEVEIDYGGATSNGWNSPNTAQTLPDMVAKRGYFFFDAEKEIQQRSAFSSLYDIKLATYLIPAIKSALNTHFQVQTANYYCFQANGSWTGNPFTYSGFSSEIPTNNHPPYGQGNATIDLVCSHTQWFTNKGRRTVDSNNTEYYMYTNLPRPLTWQMDWQLQYDTGGEEASPGLVRYENPNFQAASVVPATMMHPESRYSYIINRSFDTISTTNPASPSLFTWPLRPSIDYNLWCFEFQDLQTLAVVEDSKHVKNQAYAFGITAVDTTLTVVDQITGSFYDAFLEFEEYYHLARDNCAYGDAISTMNEQFSVYANSHYSGYAEDRKPWNLAPMMFHMHLQLLYNHYNLYEFSDVHGGRAPDMTKLMNAVTQDITLVDPDSATFYDIEKFYEDYKTLWDRNYSAQGGSDFYNTYTNQIREQRLTYGYDGMAESTTHFYAPMPDMLELGPEPFSWPPWEDSLATLYDLADQYNVDRTGRGIVPPLAGLIAISPSLGTSEQQAVKDAFRAAGQRIVDLLSKRGTRSSAMEDIANNPGVNFASLSFAATMFYDYEALGISALSDDAKNTFIETLSVVLGYELDWADAVENFEQILLQTIAIVDSYLNGIMDTLVNEGIERSWLRTKMGMTIEEVSDFYSLYTDSQFHGFGVSDSGGVSAFAPEKKVVDYKGPK